MALVVVDEAKPELTKLMLSKAMTLRLFKNDRTPALGDKFTDYEEADFSGYSPTRLEPPLWAIAGSTAEYDPLSWQVFASDSEQEPQRVHGYYVTIGKRLRWAERFANVYTIQFFGDEIKVRPVFGSE